MHVGEEGHARPGWTTSRRGQDSPWKSQSEWQRTGINGESTSMLWPTLGSRTAKEQNRIVCIDCYDTVGRRKSEPSVGADNRLQRVSLLLLLTYFSPVNPVLRFRAAYLYENCVIVFHYVSGKCDHHVIT